MPYCRYGCITLMTGGRGCPLSACHVQAGEGLPEKLLGISQRGSLRDARSMLVGHLVLPLWVSLGVKRSVQSVPECLLCAKNHAGLCVSRVLVWESQ